MADLKLGTKRECSGCSTKFYDFGKPEAVCPKCGVPVEPPKEEPKKTSRKKAKNEEE